MPDGARETKDVPANVRLQVVTRDAGLCRMCGKFLGERACLHHVVYRSQGGQHVPENLLSLCWLPGDNNCHQRVHSSKLRWGALAQAAAVTPGVTMLQLARWSRRAVV